MSVRDFQPFGPAYERRWRLMWMKRARRVKRGERGIGGSGGAEGEKTRRGLCFEGLTRYMMCLVLWCGVRVCTCMWVCWRLTVNLRVL